MSGKTYYYRTCQECGHKQPATQPDRNKELTNAYRNAKCKKCRSEALDYGTTDAVDDWF